MKTILSGLFLFILINGLTAQEIDSLKNKSTYQHAWETAMLDGKISNDERALMDVLIESLMMGVDSTRIWETQWKYKAPLLLDQSGRWPLVMQNIALGAGLYGWGIPYVLHAEDERWMIGGEMISMGGAFYLTYQYTREMEITHARTQMMRYGELLGLRYGLGVNQIFDLDGWDKNGERQTLWAWILMASVPAGHFGGEYLYKNYRPSNGQSWVWTMWTAAAGITTRLTHDLFDTEPEYPLSPDWNTASDADWDAYYGELEQFHSEKDDWEKRKTMAELMGYPLGALGGYYLIQDKQYSFGDALMLLQGYGFGFINTMMLQSLLFDDLESEVFLMNAGLGAMGSALAYDHWIKLDDYTFGQSTLMLLGSASGTAFGFGTAILFDISEKEPMLTLALAGYGAGTYLTRKILDVKSGGSLTNSNHIRLWLAPTALSARGTDDQSVLIPALDLRCSFR